jgi:diguanylate cyclase (GGDEF)-like protein
MIAGQIAESLLPGGSIDVKHCFERLDRGEKVPDGVIDWRECSYLLTIQAVQDTRDRVTGITLALTDVTEQQRMRQALAATNRKLEAANAQLSDLAENDYLTGLPNRRRFDEVLLSEVARAHRDNQPVSLLMLDVDHFKTYNDHYGHQAGDECMRRLAQIFRAGVLRPGDLICRYGGEEFAAILPDTEPEAALQVAERLRLSVFEAKLAHAGSASGRVTVSIGVGTLLKLYSVGTGSAALIKAADESLYAAKKSGRNQVCPAVSS